MKMKLTQQIVTFTALYLFASNCSGSLALDSSRTIEVHAHRFGFAPSEITVKKGETIRLTLVSDDVPHSLLLKDLGINQAVEKSHPSEVVFTAKQTGDFQGRCGRFCGNGHGRMTFMVHVTGN
jgi:cytochrome c oxidase subunit 2